MDRLLPLAAAFLISACSSTAVPAEFTVTPNPAVRTAVPTLTAVPNPTGVPISETVPATENAETDGGFISVPEPPTIDFAEGAPISGSRFHELLRSPGHMVREAQFHFSMHSSFGCNLRRVAGRGDLEQRFSTRTALIGALLYPSEEERSTDWTLDPESGAARLVPDGDCAQARAGVVGVADADDPLFGFFSTGFAIESAIGYGNIVVVFADGPIPGGNELGGDGLDPTIRAELSTLIRSLDDESSRNASRSGERGGDTEAPQ